MKKKYVVLIIILVCVLVLGAVGGFATMKYLEAKAETEAAIININNLIKAGSIEEAYEKCKGLNANAIKIGSPQIYSAVVENLNTYIKKDWIKNSGEIQSEYITEIKNLRLILELLEYDKSSSNAIDFANSVAQLEQYTKWNNFCSSDAPNEIKSILGNVNRALELIDKGFDAGGAWADSYFDMAGGYFDDAYSSINSLKTAMNKLNGYGITETKKYLTELESFIGSIYSNIYNYDSIPSSLSSAENKYQSMLSRAASDIEKAEKVVNSFPKSIY